MKPMKEQNTIKRPYEAPESFVVRIEACHIIADSGQVPFDPNNPGGADVREEHFLEMYY